jgi:surfeit locus 1 family protein
MSEPRLKEIGRQASPIRRWAFFALAVAVGLACLRLGIWQLDRLAERRARNAAALARLELPPLGLPRDIGDEAGLDYRRAAARGVFDPSNEVYLSGRSMDGIAGLRVVTPLRLEGSEKGLLVDRGWISDTTYRADPPETWADEGSLEISGILLPSQQEPGLALLADRLPAPGEPPLREWRALNIPGIQAQVPYPLLADYLVQESPPEAPGAPTLAPELDLSEGPHLGYAIQWFAFAGIALLGAVLWLRRAAPSAISE